MKIHEVIAHEHMRGNYPGGTKFKLKKPAKPMYPHAVEMTYMKALLKVAAMAHAIVNTHLKPHLHGLVKSADRVRQDSWTGALNEIMRLMEVSMARQLTQREKELIAKTAAHEVNRFNKKDLTRVLSHAIGVDIFLAEPKLAKLMEEFVEENVALITSIPKQYFADIESKVMAGIKSGMRTEELADLLEKRYGVTQSRAELIARDQVSKFNGDLTETRHRELGIHEYIWRGIMDERERESHVAHEGETYSWADPPADTGHPGDDYQCRCVAEPVLTNLF